VKFQALRVRRSDKDSVSRFHQGPRRRPQAKSGSMDAVVLPHVILLPDTSAAMLLERFLLASSARVAVIRGCIARPLGNHDAIARVVAGNISGEATIVAQ